MTRVRLGLEPEHEGHAREGERHAQDHSNQPCSPSSRIPNPHRHPERIRLQARTPSNSSSRSFLIGDCPFTLPVARWRRCNAVCAGHIRRGRRRRRRRRKIRCGNGRAARRRVGVGGGGSSIGVGGGVDARPLSRRGRGGIAAAGHLDPSTSHRRHLPLSLLLTSGPSLTIPTPASLACDLCTLACDLCAAHMQPWLNVLNLCRPRPRGSSHPRPYPALGLLRDPPLTPNHAFFFFRPLVGVMVATHCEIKDVKGGGTHRHTQ